MYLIKDLKNNLSCIYSDDIFCNKYISRITCLSCYLNMQMQRGISLKTLQVVKPMCK